MKNEENSNYYVTNNDLIPELKKFSETGVMNEKLGRMVLKISTELANKGNFSGYTWKDDMISEGVLAFIRFGKSFDPSISNNAFAYISMSCYRAFIAYIKKQKKHAYIKDACYDFMGIAPNEIKKFDAIDYTVIKRVC